jgi:hypothetical protein
MTRGIAFRLAALLLAVGFVGLLITGWGLFALALLLGVGLAFTAWLIWGAAPNSYPPADDLRRADVDDGSREAPIVPTNLPGPP